MPKPVLPGSGVLLLRGRLGVFEHPAAKQALFPAVTGRDMLTARRDFPAWHFAMLNDQRRNAAIENSIAALELRDKIVFEIGAGTGLIAMLFAKHGAEHVFTCEMNANLARVAHDNVAASPYRDRITVIHAASRHVVETGILQRQPDILFTETVDCGVVGEGFFQIRDDIQSIAQPDTLILPTLIEQSGALIESPAIRGLNEVGLVCGLDLSALNRFSTQEYFPVRAPLHEFELLNDARVVRTYDYRSQVDNIYSTIETSHSGMAHGLLSWFTLYFGEHAVSNSVHLDSHWHQAFHPFLTPVPVKAGERLRLKLDDRGSATIIRL